MTTVQTKSNKKKSLSCLTFKENKVYPEAIIILNCIDLVYLFLPLQHLNQWVIRKMAKYHDSLHNIRNDTNEMKWKKQPNYGEIIMWNFVSKISRSLQVIINLKDFI